MDPPRPQPHPANDLTKEGASTSDYRQSLKYWGLVSCEILFIFIHLPLDIKQNLLTYVLQLLECLFLIDKAFVYYIPPTVLCSTRELLLKIVQLIDDVIPNFLKVRDPGRCPQSRTPPVQRPRSQEDFKAIDVKHIKFMKPSTVALTGFPDLVLLQHQLELVYHPPQVDFIMNFANTKYPLKGYEQWCNKEDTCARHESQDWKCLICRCDIDAFGEYNGQILVCGNIDHDHFFEENNPDANRGLLCPLCNTTLGRFKDSINWVTNAALYISAFESRRPMTFKERVLRCGGGAPCSLHTKDYKTSKKGHPK